MILSINHPFLFRSAGGREGGGMTNKPNRQVLVITQITSQSGGSSYLRKGRIRCQIFESTLNSY